jgi:glycosyltransferase involved in cell wall biosynthesis
MKIIIIHYRYYEASGPERYLFNITKLLQDNGHEVIPFSLDFKENRSSEYSKYFAKPVVEHFHIDKAKSNLSFSDKLGIIKNSFYNKEVYNKLTELLETEKPDLVYVLQYGVKLSTSIFDACKDKNLPIVLRLSDFNLLCSKNVFYRNGEICTKCINNKFNSLKYKCVHGSLAQSFVYYLTEKYNELRKFEDKIDAFITPSKFTKDTIQQSNQFKNSNFYHAPTFIDKAERLTKKNRDYNTKEIIKFCYVGRIADDKGIDILIEAINKLSDKDLNIQVDIYGDDKNQYAQEQLNTVNKLKLQNIEFKGYVKASTINEVFEKYHYSIIPSKWYDNMPNSLIESSINGIPVIVSSIGSLGELINDGENGFAFENNNPQSLADKIESLFLISEDNYNQLSQNSYNWIKNYSDKSKHYNRLINIFENLNEKYSK